MQNHSLKTVHLSSGYDKKMIIENMDVEISQHKINIIIGSNGSGKSTLLKTFCRLLKPQQGQVLLNEQSIHQYPSKKLAQMIGFMPQSPIAPEGISVSDLISRGRFPYREPFKTLSHKDYGAIQEAMNLMGVAHLSNRDVNELSGGQRQRVWLALALAQDTDILFLDEPTTFLDIAYQIEILDLLTQLNRKKGTTIVMVLHDINLSARYGDYLFALANGKLIAQGAPKEIITAELMKQVYDLKCQVIKDPISNNPLIIPIGKFHTT